MFSLDMPGLPASQEAVIEPDLPPDKSPDSYGGIMEYSRIRSSPKSFRDMVLNGAPRISVEVKGWVEAKKVTVEF